MMFTMYTSVREYVSSVQKWESKLSRKNSVDKMLKIYHRRKCVNGKSVHKKLFNIINHLRNKNENEKG